MFGNTITIVGNLTRDPELKFLPNGSAVAEIGVAWNKKSKDRNGVETEEANYFDVTCWDTLGENVSSSLGRGDRVVVTGRLSYRTWESKEGEKRSKVEIIADEVSPSLRWASVEVSRNERTGNDGGSNPKPLTEVLAGEPF